VLRMHVFERNPSKAREIGEAILQLSQRQSYPFFVGTSMVNIGWALAQCGETRDGIQFCRDGLAQLQAIGSKYWLPRYLGLLAECYEKAGEDELCSKALTEALETTETIGERLWASEIWRLKGRLIARTKGDFDAAKACFVEAVSLARQKQAKLLELRAAAGLAELLKNAGLADEAECALRPIYDWFTEGLDFIDLREARALLGYLEGNSAEERSCT
jgi:predicted ATPase